jgi:uncharacterized protein (DUF2336 family)
MLQAGVALEDELERLTQEPSATTRAFHAVRAGAALDDESLTVEQRAAALEFVRRFARDAEAMVRIVLAERIKSCALLPHDLARDLAMDIEKVAVPIIEYATALTDEDLIEIVRGGDPARQAAVARRQVVSAAVSDAVIDLAAEPAVTTLIRNGAAAITPDGFARSVKRFSNSAAMAASLSQRESLPAGAIERMFQVAGEGIRRALLDRGDVSAEQVDRLVVYARESAVVETLSIGSDSEQVDSLVRMLHDRRKLTDTIIVRAMLGGDTQFFVSAMALRAGVTVTTVKILMQDAGPLGLRALYGKTGMSESYFALVRAAVDAILDGQRRHVRQARQALTAAIMARVRTRADSLSNEALDLLADPYFAIGARP